MLAVASGALLLIGFLTPAAAALAALLSVGSALGWSLTPVTAILENRMAAVLVVTNATALAFLGPGAFSLDARLFGRREVLIPRSSAPPLER